MITGSWFLENINGEEDLIKHINAGSINALEYKELKQIADDFINNNFYALYDWNSDMANNLKLTYLDVLTRMEQMEKIK